MTNQPPEEKKNVHILVPEGFQNRELLRAEKGISHDASDTPSDGVCIKCKGTGAIPHKVWLTNYRVENYKIVTAEINMAWLKCRCYKGQFWIRFHPLNVQARLVPHWQKELYEMKEREKERIIRDSGGEYDSAKEQFLKHLEYKAPEQSAALKTLKDMNFSGIIKQ